MVDLFVAKTHISLVTMQKMFVTMGYFIFVAKDEFALVATDIIPLVTIGILLVGMDATSLVTIGHYLDKRAIVAMGDNTKTYNVNTMVWTREDAGFWVVVVAMVTNDAVE